MIQSCDAAIGDQKQQVSIRDLRIKEEDTQIQSLAKDNQDLKASKDAWYNSRWLWLTIGTAVGIYVEKKF